MRPGDRAFKRRHGEIDDARLARRAGRSEAKLAIRKRLAALERAAQNGVEPVRIREQVDERPAARARATMPGTNAGCSPSLC